MKKVVISILILLLPCSSAPLLAGRGSLQDFAKNTESIYRKGAGSEDGGFTAISMSMLGWGLGLAAGIAILAAVLHQSKSSTSHDNNNHCH
jgi:hypothetical protein